MKLTWPPRGEDPSTALINAQQRRIIQLEAEVLASARRELAARRQADALAARLVVQDTTPEELVRQRRTLLDYEDMLATCRRKHGSNTPSAWAAPA